MHGGQRSCGRLAALILAALGGIGLAPASEGQAAPAVPVEAGTILNRTLAADPGVSYFLYIPRRDGTGVPVFVAVHGNGRNATQQASLWAPFAERAGVVLIAPLFTRERFPDFQRLGRAGRGDRADVMLDRIVAEVASLTGARAERLSLFGYSGGAQFVHRYMLAHPERVARLAAGAAGWYTFPDPALDYPRGIKPVADLPGASFDPEKFLAIPTCVFVGDGDVLRDDDLNQDPDVDAQQGMNRLERGRRWTEAMRTAAGARGLTTPYAFHTLPGCGHSFGTCMTRANMGTRVSECLFEPSAGSGR